MKTAHSKYILGHAQVSKAKLFSHRFVSVLVSLSLFALPQIAFAAVVDDYINSVRTEVTITALPDAPSRGSLDGAVAALDTCLHAPLAANTGQFQWQYHPSGVAAPVTIDALTSLLRTDPHPCHAQFSTFNILKDSVRSYSQFMESVRRAFYTDPVNTNRFATDPVLAQQFELYSACLMRDTNGYPNWQFGGRDPSDSPHTVSDLQARLNARSPVHPCAEAKRLVTNHQPGQALVTPSTTAPAPAAPSTTADTPAAPADSAPAPAPAPANPVVAPVAPQVPVTNGTGTPATIYRGPDHLNVTSFSVFGNVSITNLLNNIISYISGLLAILAVASIMYGGVLYMTAGGDNGKIGKAKQVVILTFVGLVITAFAYMIIVFATRIFYGA